MNEELYELLASLRQKGYFNDAQASITPNNIGVPAGLLTALSPDIVENVLAYRTAEEAVGSKRKLLDWSKEEYILPFVERTGKTNPYSDFGQALNANINTSYNHYGHYRFSAAILHGDLLATQYSDAKIDYRYMILSAATESLRIEENRTAFDGYLDNTSGKFLCYGLLNEPKLPNYVDAGKTFEAMTWEEILAFFANAITALTTQTGNIINGTSRIRVVVAASAYAQLVIKHTSLGISVFETLKKTYTGMYFVSAIEFDGAYTSENVCYFIGESPAGGIADTMTLGFSEIAKMGRIVEGGNSWSQTASAGSVGTIVNKPFMVKRYYGV